MKLRDLFNKNAPIKRFRDHHAKIQEHNKRMEEVMAYRAALETALDEATRACSKDFNLPNYQKLVSAKAAVSAVGMTNIELSSAFSASIAQVEHSDESFEILLDALRVVASQLSEKAQQIEDRHRKESIEAGFEEHEIHENPSAVHIRAKLAKVNSAISEMTDAGEDYSRFWHHSSLVLEHDR